MKALSRRHILNWMGLAAATQLLPTCFLIQKPIKVAAHLWPGYEPIFFAQKLNEIDRKKVEILQTKNANETLSLLETGKIDGGCLTLDEVLRARQKGLDLCVVWVNDVSAGADQVVSRKPIKNAQDLKGKKIAYEQGAVGELMLELFLENFGLHRDEVKLINLSADQHMTSWNNKEVDIVITFEPQATLMLKSGGISIFDSRQTSDLIIDVLVMRSEVLNWQYKESIKNLINGIIHALEHFTHLPTDSSYQISSHLGVKPEQVFKLYRGMLLPDREHNQKLLSGGKTSLLNQKSHRILNILTKHKIVQQPDNLSTLVCDDYL